MQKYVITTNKKRLNLILDERELGAIERLKAEMAERGVELSTADGVHVLLRRAIANWPVEEPATRRAKK